MALLPGISLKNLQPRIAPQRSGRDSEKDGRRASSSIGTCVDATYARQEDAAPGIRAVVRTALIPAWRKYIFAGEKSGPNERSVSGGNQNRRTHFRARRRIKRKYRRPKPMLRFDGAFQSCQTAEMTPAVLIHHRLSLLTCVIRASLSASVSLPSHGG